MEKIDLYLENAEEDMVKAMNHINNELMKIRAGKATPIMLDGLNVEYYGSSIPVAQVATIQTPDARTITIKPWEKGMLSQIERAIINSNLGFNPQNDGDIIRISIPPLTEERRKSLVKQAKTETENGKVRIRNIRKKTNEKIRDLLKEDISEDSIREAGDASQKLTNSYIIKIDNLLEKKEADIMTI